ncbi:glucosamine-6-phosphate deaminase [Alienimonas californiensis]|uniref:Glucosamine-6-phosphate deaminase n=1 Tax=Alienimonas californiensis TaxID=2527989 RepID=A0A517PC09_9PLAN|nr:glucosamine-6-phosphate deaminase [Alienimonas californiensis]QDT16913.1 Glucosamine-6-phosphate deaminase [Alienimonas californiensis]
MQIEIHSDAAAMGRAAAARGADVLRRAIAENGSAALIVATGASQFEVLAALVKEPDIDWSKVVGFHLDEYLGLPLDHPASFRGYLRERFVSKVPLKAFHELNGEAADPDAELRRVGDLLTAQPIDVAFVGIGENGHLAFNDPPADFETRDPYLVVDLDEACRRQQHGEGWFDSLEAVPKQALSMSVRQILQSRMIVCSVPDERKADAVRASVEGPVTPEVPASILQQHADCTLMLDEAAASKLSNR